MKIFCKKVTLIAVVIISFSLGSSCFQQNSISNNTNNQDILRKAQAIFASDECIPKGRVGIVKEGFYVVTETKENIILLPKNEARWQGSQTGNQVVFIYKGSVLDNLLPDDFNVNESIIISFEKDRITFFDFATFEGGYYRRN